MNQSGIEVAAEVGGAAAVARVHAAGKQVVAAAPGALQAPIVQARAMVDTILPATYDDLTGTEIGIEFQRILCFYCWDMRFYHCDAHVKRTFNGGKPSLVGPNGEQTFTLRLREM